MTAPLKLGLALVYLAGLGSIGVTWFYARRFARGPLITTLAIAAAVALVWLLLFGAGR